jgi:hypothetical protein
LPFPGGKAIFRFFAAFNPSLFHFLYFDIRLAAQARAINFSYRHCSYKLRLRILTRDRRLLRYRKIPQSLILESQIVLCRKGNTK